MTGQWTAVDPSVIHGFGVPCDDGSCATTPRMITGVDSAQCLPCGEPEWSSRGPIPWEIFAQGEYIGPARTAHVGEYRLRVDDRLDFVYRLTRERSGQPYRLNVGDRIRVESLADENIDRELIIQSDGTIVVPFVGTVVAADRTTDELRADLEDRYKKYYQIPSVTVTPMAVNTKLEDLLATVDNRQGIGGQTRSAQVTPDGTVQLPAIGSVPAQGLSVTELQQEINARYASLVVDGIEVTPVLTQRAPRFVYVLGEVRTPGRFELTQPTTVMGSLSLAQGWNVGANLRQVVIFRRADDWRLMATKVDIRGALYGKRPAPSDEIWLRDQDVVVVPKAPIRVLDDAIRLIFTEGIYAAAPILSDGTIFTSQSRL
jgi:polysaccharide export outer membrane protein